MDLVFRRPQQERIFQSVAEQIQAAILDGRLKPGAHLPSELKLKEMFETSRGSVREALRVLEQRGLLAIRKGASGGAVIRELNTERVVDDLSLLLQYQKVSYAHLTEFREDVEGSVTGLAAERATRKDLARLRHILGDGKRLLEAETPDIDAYIRMDREFHKTVAEAAGNPVYVAILQVIDEKILASFEMASVLKRKGVLQENFQDLCEIVEALEKGEGNRARSVVRVHVRRFERYMKPKLPTRPTPRTRGSR
jgi:GntR family transcriptional regulator, transcriptional repressor for pyruvate dehydrogenase complex